MAKNIRIQFEPSVDMVVTVPTTDAANGIPASGTPVLVGSIPGIAHDKVAADTGKTPVCPECIAEVPVNGVGAAGNAAINAGDVLYMQTNGQIDKNSGGAGAKKFGVAYGNSLDAVTNKLGTDTQTGQLVASAAAGTIIRVWVGKLV